MGIIYRAAVFAQERHDIVAAVIDDIEQFDMVDSKAVSGACLLYTYEPTRRV